MSEITNIVRKDPVRQDEPSSDVSSASAGSVPSTVIAQPSSGAPARPTAVMVTARNFPASLGDGVELFRGTDGHAYVHRVDDKRQPVLRVGTKFCNAFLRGLARAQDRFPSSADLYELNEHLTSQAELSQDVRDVWYRVAPVPGGREIDVGDAALTRIRIADGVVTVLKSGSDALFYRTPTMKALPIPADQGDLARLHRYLNLYPADQTLLIGWIGLTLSTPKQPSASFPVLVLQGDQGSGKSFLCRIIQSLVDPNEVGLRTFPRGEQELAIAAQYAHVLMFDNMREIRPWMSDRLCTAATGGTFTARRLYSDADQLALRLHVAIILNGIVPFVDQPDLAQRCLPLTMLSLDETKRRDEAAMERELVADLPVIFRGQLELIAGVLHGLPDAEVTNPERMLDYVRWLAGMEQFRKLPPGVFQAQYSAVLTAGMRESLEVHPLAAAVIALVAGEEDGKWHGTPRALYDALDRAVGRRTTYSRSWPDNEIAMGKQLRLLRPGLHRQGIDVTFSRSHKRLISITRLRGPEHD